MQARGGDYGGLLGIVLAINGRPLGAGHGFRRSGCVLLLARIRLERYRTERARAPKGLHGLAQAVHAGDIGLIFQGMQVTAAYQGKEKPRPC